MLSVRPTCLSSSRGSNTGAILSCSLTGSSTSKSTHVTGPGLGPLVLQAGKDREQHALTMLPSLLAALMSGPYSPASCRSYSACFVTCTEKERVCSNPVGPAVAGAAACRRPFKSADMHSHYGVCDCDWLQRLQEPPQRLRQRCCWQLLGAKDGLQLIIQLQLRQVSLHVKTTA